MLSAVMMLAVLAAPAPAHRSAIVSVDTSSSAIGVDAIHELLEERVRGWSNEEIREIAQAIYQASSRENIDPRLVLGVIHTESNFKRGAASAVGAQGLLQLMPSTAAAYAKKAGVRWRGAKTLDEPVASVRIGVTYLAFLLHRFHGNIDLALTAYCHGPYKVLKALREHGRLHAESRVYSKKVRAAWTRFNRRTQAVALSRSWRPHGPFRITSSEPPMLLLAQIRSALTSMQAYAPKS